MCGFAGIKMAVCRMISVISGYRDRRVHFSIIVIPEKAQAYC
jgi:hypothetical protein